MCIPISRKKVVFFRVNTVGLKINWVLYIK